MLDKLQALYARFTDLGVTLTNPEVVGDNKRFTAVSKEYRKLEPLAQAYKDYNALLEAIAFGKEVLQTESDAELREMAAGEIKESEVRREEMEDRIRQMLIPKDPQDEKNAIIEVRGGTGGDEAALFAGDLARMYMRYCERRGWKVALLSENEGTAGGYKDIQFEITGDDVYGTLKFESGVHRVQRVPATEASGRVHTSAATVAVMPEAEEIDFELKDSDLKNGNGPFGWCRRTEREQGGNQGNSHPCAYRHRDYLSNRAHPAGQPRKGNCHDAYQAL